MNYDVNKPNDMFEQLKVILNNKVTDLPKKGHTIKIESFLPRNPMQERSVQFILQSINVLTAPPHQEGGVLKPTHVKMRKTGKVYKIMIEKITGTRYIMQNKSRVPLFTIKGKYRLH